MAAPLLDLLRCPLCAAPVEVDSEAVVCAGELHAFPIVDGIPVLLGDDLLSSDAQYAHQREYFDEEFARYESYDLEPWRRSYLRRLAEHDALGGVGGPLVDVAVGGSGYTVIEAAKAGRDAIGCDLSLEALRTARRFAEDEGVSASVLFVCCSAEMLPLASEAFDVALAIAILEHVPDHDAALAELVRVLRPRGRAWITVPHELRAFSPLFWLPNRLHDRRLGHLRRYSAQGLISAAERHGLDPVEVQYTGHPIKVLQMAVAGHLPLRLRDRFWWWCERRDLARSSRRRGSMQLSVALRRR